MASDGEFSDFEDDTETLVQIRPRKTGASPRPRSAKKGGKTVGGPYGPTGRNSRQSMSRSLKEGGSNTGTKKSTQQENYTNTLRHTGQGITSLSSHNMQSITGLKKGREGNMGYNSTSHFLRQSVGTEKSSKIKIERGKPAPGTPAYKSPEEYYDQILELKKQIQAMNQENSNMKSKVGRLEKDNVKKEKEIEQLLDPSKSEEMRRTLADRKPDTGAVMHSLKQRILKLEKQLKEKEAEFTKLQSDVKTTKIDELRMQMEAYYKEVVRLNQLKSVDSPAQRKSAGSPAVKESPSKMKALQDTILKMNEKNYHLQMENKSLKEDLDKKLEDKKAAKDLQAEYQDMSKKELLSTVSKLEKRLDKAEETTSMMSEVEGRSNLIEGKIPLQGSAAQRLDILDKRETELLDELKKKNEQLKKLKEDRAHYRKKCEERDKEITSLKRDVEDLHTELNGFYDKDKSRVTPRTSPRRKTTSSVSHKKVEDFRQKHAAKTIQKNWRQHQKHSNQRHNQDQDEKLKIELDQKVKSFQENRSAKVIQRSWKGYKQEKQEEDEREEELDDEKNKRIEHFRKNRAARSIQKEWRGYRSKSQETDEAAELLQSYFRAHQTRSQTVKSAKRGGSRYNQYDDDDDTLEDTMSESQMSMEGTGTSTLHSLYKGQLSRANNTNSFKKGPTQPFQSRTSSKPSVLDEDTIVFLQSTLRGHQSRKTIAKKRNRDRPTSSKGGRGQSRQLLDSAGESEEESDDIRSSTLGNSFSGRASVTSGHSAHSKFNSSSKRGRTPPPKAISEDEEDDDDDDDDSDDFIISPSKGKKLF